MSTEEEIPAESAEIIQEKKRLNRIFLAVRILVLMILVAFIVALFTVDLDSNQRLIAAPFPLVLSLLFYSFSATINGKISDLGRRAESERAQDEVVA